MSIKLQLFIIAIITTSIISIVLLVKRRTLHLKYALIWLAVGSIILILTAFPSTLYSAADMLNVESPTNMLFFMGFIFSLAIILSLTIALSRVSERVKSLAQDQAILKEKVTKRESAGN